MSHHSLFLEVGSESRRARSWQWDGAFMPKSSSSPSADPPAANFYVHAPARTDPSACPVGHDAITVLVPAPALSEASTEAYNTGERAHALPGPCPFLV